MPVEDNSYPNPGNYPAPSFKRPIPLPDIPPDEGNLIYVGYNPAWTPALMGAVTQLLLPSTWQGDHETVIDALNEASVLQWLLTNPVTAPGGVPAPYWDDDEDNDDEATPEAQEWYGTFIDPEGFQATLENWVIAGFIAYAGAPGAALTFLTLAPKFRLAWRTSDLGGLIKVFIDGAMAGEVDTYSPAVGVLERTFLGNPDQEEHQIMMVLEDAPPQPPPVPPIDGGSGNAGMSVIRRRLTQSLNVFPAFRYNPDTGDVEVTTNGTTWTPDPGADPRYNPAYQYDMTGKHRCGVAAGVVVQIEKWAATAAASASFVGLMNNLLGNANELIPVDLLGELYQYVAGVVEDIGVTAIEDAFDAEALRKIKCILLTCLGDDSAFTAAEVEQAKAGVLAEFGDTVVSECFNLLAESWGQVGMTNAGWVNYDDDADCDCDECAVAYVDNFYYGIGWRTKSLDQSPNTPAVWQPTGGRTGGGVLASSFHATAGYQLRARVDLGQDCYVTFVSSWWRKLSASNSYQGMYIRIYNSAGAQVYNRQVQNNNTPNSNWQQHGWNGINTVGRYVDVIVQASSPAGGLYLSQVEVYAG